MAQRTFKRLLVITALLCILTLALPPRAAAAAPGGSEGLWGWLTGLVESRILTLWGLGRNAVSSSGAPQLKGGDQGPGVDPNGAAGPACSTCGDAGPGFDPNG